METKTLYKVSKFVLDNGEPHEKAFIRSIMPHLQNGLDLGSYETSYIEELARKYPSFNDNGNSGATENTDSMFFTDFSPISFKDEKKERIQRYAFRKWEENNHRGSFEIATGVGKTLIGLMGIKKFLGKKIVVVVPKVDLQEQWYNEVKETFNLSDDDIGKVGAGYNEIDKKIVIAVVNSLRDKFISSDLLIMDEMHRYASYENVKFLVSGIHQAIMGLTATFSREDGRDSVFNKFCPLIYTFKQREAISGGLLSEFELHNVKVEFEEEERKKYETLDEYFRRTFREVFNNDFQYLQNILTSPEYNDMKQVAADVMKAMTRRRNMLLHTQNKITKTVEIIQENSDKKCLVFCEYVKTADAILNELKKVGVYGGKYHSKMTKKSRDDMLKKFASSECKVMVSVKSLDEGTNIPDCDMAIFVAGTKVKRQTIQRLGRILRTYDGKQTAKVYQLYVPYTKDYDWMKERLKELQKTAKTIKWY
ncbi:MAG: DEAD/DEAH box helicase [bacterium]